MHRTRQPRPPAPSTMAAALGALGSGALAAVVAYVKVRQAIDPEFDAARREGLVLLGVPADTTGLGILAWLTAALATATAVLALALGVGLLLRRPWAREGGFAVFGGLALLVIAVSLQGLVADPPARNAHWGLLFGVAQALIVMLLFSKATAADIERADFVRQRARFAAQERRRQRREAVQHQRHLHAAERALRGGGPPEPPVDPGS